MEHKNTYYIYKHILQGTNNANDIDHFLKDNKNTRLLQIINTMRYNFDNSMGTIEFLDFLDQISKEKYKEDIYILLEENPIKDTIKRNTIDRIIMNKPNKKIVIEDTKEKNIQIIDKKCPHCNHINQSHKDNQYIVCGFYLDSGYDLDGCGRDWCFSCGKKLCKVWSDNELYLISNRVHNSKCCMKYAEENNFDYESEFCMCSSVYVSRDP